MLKIMIPENWAEKPPHPQPLPTPRMREIFLTSDLFQVISSNFGFCVRKAPPAPPRMRENILTSDLSISGNFEQLWFLWQKSPPSQDEGIFLTSDLSISGNFEQLWFLWQKSPPPQDEGKFLTSDVSISGNFKTGLVSHR